MKFLEVPCSCMMADSFRWHRDRFYWPFITTAGLEESGRLLDGGGGDGVVWCPFWPRLVALSLPLWCWGRGYGDGWPGLSHTAVPVECCSPCRRRTLDGDDGDMNVDRRGNTFTMSSYLSCVLPLPSFLPTREMLVREANAFLGKTVCGYLAFLV